MAKNITNVQIISKLSMDDYIFVESEKCFRKINKRDFIESLSEQDNNIQYVLNISSNPNESVIKINGVTTSFVSVSSGSNVEIEVSKEGYNTHREYVIVDNNISKTINLSRVTESGFDYYFGEVGNIYANNPSLITETIWDEKIKADRIGASFNYYPNVISLPLDINAVATGMDYQWWMMMIPFSETSVVSELQLYQWSVWDELSNGWAEYSNEVYNGTFEADGILWVYSAIRPTVITKVRFSK